VLAAYPTATRLTLVHDNWLVHRHPDLLDPLQADPRVQVLFLPTYAPWTNPVEQVWRLLKADVLHLHELTDEWSRLQHIVAAWLAQWDQPSPTWRKAVGLCPQ
jgi:putative transposase